MGSTESTGRSNEEERQPESTGGSMGDGTAVALAAAGTVLTAWGISRMISGSSDSESKEKDDAMKINAHGMESSSPNFPSREYIYESMGSRSIWSPPPPGRFKMNTDAVCLSTKQSDGVERGPSGYAGILRNDRGIWVGGFLGFHSMTNILPAEIYAINGGLELLKELLKKDDRYRGSLLESDSQEAVNWIHGDYDNIPKPAVIKDIWDIIENIRKLAGDNNIDISYIKGKNANQCADRLANIAVAKKKEYLELENLPQDTLLKSHYDQDLKSCNR